MKGYGYIVVKVKGLSENEMCIFNNPFSIESLLWFIMTVSQQPIRIYLKQKQTQ